MSNVLVTGAGGFIGSHLCTYLASKGHKVMGVDIFYPDREENTSQPAVQYVVGDFRDSALMEKVLNGVQVVFHLASAHLKKSLPDSEYWDINVYSLRPFLDLVKKHSVQRFIHISSVGVYGNLDTIPAHEETPCKPQSVYGKTKLAGEEEVRKFSADTGLPFVIVRPAWVYGPRCTRTLKIYKTLCKGRFVMIGRGENLRHPIYIADILDAFYLTMKKKEAIGEIFVIGGEEAITTRELINTFCKVFNMPEPRITIPYKMGLLMAYLIEYTFSIMGKEPPFSKRSLEFFDTDNSFDISKSRSILGFTPKYTLEEGLLEYKAWLKDAIVS